MAAPQLDLGGRVAVVTGAAAGIGRAVALRLAEEGARLALLDIADARETASAIESHGGDVWQHTTDLTDVASITAAFKELDGHWGPPTVLVNVAGVFADLPFLETPPEVYDQVMAVNARGVFFCSQAAALRMATAGGGRIVNILSTASAQGFALESAYCASKGAALLLTRTMAVELARYGIQVNGVGPGTVRTAMGGEYLGDGPIAPHELARTPLGRFGEPEDIADAVAFLATRASWMTGQVLYVDGGFLAAGLPWLEGIAEGGPLSRPA
jgi:NAD(P)-dependent dehydrogenase (short-subunit alcohol dehydrogenase family)